MLTVADKIKLNGVIQKGVKSLHYDVIRATLSKKVSDEEIILYLYENIDKFLSSDDELPKRFSTWVYMIVMILVYHTLQKMDLDSSCFEKLETIRNKYLDYLKRTGKEKDINLYKLLEDMGKVLINYHLEIDGINGSKDMGHLENLDKGSADNSRKEELLLKEEIESLKKDISTLEEKVISLTKILEKKESSITRLQKDRKEKIRTIKDLKDLIEEQKKNLKDYERIKRELERQLKQATLKGEEYDSLCLQVQALEKELENCQTLLKHVQEENVQYINEKKDSIIILEEEKSLDSLIIQELTKNPNGVTMEYLVNQLKRDREVIYQRLQILSRQYNIISPNKACFPFRYRFCRSLYAIYKNFFIDIEPSATSLDLVFVSDYHIKVVDDAFQYRMDILYNYCIKNNVHLIINAGDFFSDAYYEQIIKKENISLVVGRMEQFCLKHPYDSSITQAIMGGNHDLTYLENGVNLIQSLAEKREDFIDLGYKHAFIHFGNDKGTYHSVALHHPNLKCESHIEDDFYHTQELFDLVGDYDSYEGRSADDFYVDLLGHFHRMSIDTVNGICSLPSLFKDRVQNGACHLKIYFDKEQRITNIVFIPLILLSEQLIAVNEINYQKKTFRKKH